MFGEKNICFQKNFNLDYEEIVINEKKIIGEDDENSDEDDDFENAKISNKYYYIVNRINRKNFMIEDNNFNDINIEKLTFALLTHQSNIKLLANNNSIFVNNFIKSQTFAKLSPKRIRINYPDLQSLYDFKIIIDGLIRLKCEIPLKCLDYKYNFITPNLSLNIKRGSEIYNPPYGWIGIGLNVIDKYDKVDNSWLNKDNNLWAIAYYGFGKHLPSQEIIKMLKNIILNNDFKRELTIKCHDSDIRHNRKKVGSGIYLSPNINIAEQNSGTLIFNKKRYKIVLMARVFTKKIREPEDHSFWILNNDDIHIYRILVKEKI